MSGANSRHRVRRVWPNSAMIKNIQEFVRAVETKKQLESHERAIRDLQQELTKVRAGLNALEKSFTTEHCGVAEQAKGA
ncbi:MAG: hypothetical protein KBG12_09415 [Syntrophobacterales bacterium]|nr:hypothetical protein [Syntrophobacterales bacterium]